MIRKYLLGATENFELAFATIEVRDWNGFPQFSASFFTVLPFKEDFIDLEEYAKSMLEGLDKATLYDMCEKNGCAPQDLASEIAYTSDITDLIDCSLYPECITVNFADYYFESESCGQYDTRDEMFEYVNKDLYDIIMQLWDNYHLKETTDEVNAQLVKLDDFYKEFDEYAWIINYLTKKSDNL